MKTSYIVWTILGLWIASLIAVAHYKLEADSHTLLYLGCRDDLESVREQKHDLLDRVNYE